ncbi:MAG: cupin domain-containing protein [Gemmatimonadetes bacterium]|jgi:quercetin dioxygenase-like cupin family protein|nr:cupin domain-containing protein [Gemmatimonadota bacterium]
MSTAHPAGAVVLAAGETRSAAPLNIVGETTHVLVAGDDSGGQFASFHLGAPPMSGPPLHVHSREDEWFYVLDGELVFELDGDRRTVRAGGSVFLRRGVTHRYQNFTDREARLLITTTPAGLDRFFEAMDAMTPPGGLPAMDQLMALDAEFGLTTLGPPMGPGDRP